MPNSVEVASGSLIRSDQIVTIKVDEGHTGVRLYLQTTDGKSHLVVDFPAKRLSDKYPELANCVEGNQIRPKSMKKALKKALAYRDFVYDQLDWDEAEDLPAGEDD